MRTDLKIHQIKPGITGLAQIEGRDNLPLKEKVKLDKNYFDSQSFLLDLKIVIITLKKIIFRDGVSH